MSQQDARTSPWTFCSHHWELLPAALPRADNSPCPSGQSCNWRLDLLDWIQAHGKLCSARHNAEYCSQLQAGCLAQAMSQGYNLEELLQGTQGWKHPALRATGHKKQRKLCLGCHFLPLTHGGLSLGCSVVSPQVRISPVKSCPDDQESSWELLENPSSSTTGSC